LRYSEVTTCYRDEQAGELQGLSRVRALTQDDAHVFCTPDQIKEEINSVYEIVDGFYQAFDFEIQARLSLWDPKKPEKYLGKPEVWEKSQTILRDIMKEKGVAFIEEEGEAAFYGPKIDFKAKDSLGREWQLATIQLDFNLPERFGLSFIDDKGEDSRVVMIHRAILGSVERFMAILIEHYAGVLPLWLSPTQVKVLPISDDQFEYADEITKELKQAGIRAEIDSRAESIGKKIRESEIMKVPVMLIIGEKEQTAKEVSIRKRGQEDAGTNRLPTLIEELVADINNRT